MKNILVIFDCDGVLVDSEYIACKIEAAELTRMGYAISTEDNIRRFAGKSQKTIMETVEKALGRKLPEGFDGELQEKIIKALASELQAIPGMAQALETIPAKCIASSGSMEKIANSLKTTGLDRYFQPTHIFSATMVKNGKPAPDLFLYAAAQMGYGPEDCVVIEDSLYGVQAGKAAGMRVLGFTGGSHIVDAGHGDMLKAAGADEVYADMGQLPGLLKKMGK